MRKPRYQFLSRNEKNAIDWINEKLLLDLLESGDVGAFNTIIGTIQDLKDVTGRVNPDQERCLRLPSLLFEAAVRPVLSTASELRRTVPHLRNKPA